MATREFTLPDVGEGVAEGELVEWLVAAGDRVSEDQPVARVETDKALVEVPAPVDGVVTELRADEGEVVPVGEVIVVFETDGGEAPAGSGEASAQPETEPEPDSAGGTAASGRVFAAPSARRLARELGVDIAGVEGSGPGGRVTESDVRACAADESHEEAPAESERAAAPEPASVEPGEGESAIRPAGGEGEGGAAAGQAPAAADRERTLAAPATRRLADELGVDLDAVPTDEECDGEAFARPEHVRAFAEARERSGGEATAAGAEAAGEPTAAVESGEELVETIPYRGIRRTIGERMEESAYTAPHVTHHDAADVSALVDLRADLKPAAEERGARLTYLSFVMKAVVAALREYPILNSTLDEEAGEIRAKGYYDVGVAVATEAGLVVPVVEGVDEKGVLALATEVEDLGERARERSLERAEMEGSTFTITNFGAIGGEYATPIINYPETAILGLGRIAQRPRVVDGEVLARHTLPLSLSIDHRVIDGAEAAAFTNRLIELLEEPTLLFLE